MSTERRTIYYSGAVQGVGFRWRALRTLRGAPLTGFVRNLPDGRVELVLEGAAAEAKAGQDAVTQALSSCITAIESSKGPPTGEFADLGVRT